MLIFLATVASAEPPQVFDPVPADVKIDGKMYSGILVDEATFAELGELRTLKKVNDEKLAAFGDWKTWADTHYSQEVADLRVSCDAGQVRLTDHYEGLLKDERKRDFFEKQGFSLGAAVGIVGSSVLYLGATYLYGGVFQVQFQK